MLQDVSLIWPNFNWINHHLNQYLKWLSEKFLYKPAVQALCGLMFNNVIKNPARKKKGELEFFLIQLKVLFRSVWWHNWTTNGSWEMLIIWLNLNSKEANENNFFNPKCRKFSWHKKGWWWEFTTITVQEEV